MTTEWPREPWRRRTVLVLGDGDVDYLRYEGGSSVLLNDEVHIIEHPLREDSSPVGGLGTGLRRGDVLVQSPYDAEGYKPAKDSARAFAIEKCAYVFRVCQLLGARKIEIARRNNKGRASAKA